MSGPGVIHPGKARAFGPDYAHDVRNVSLAPAISIHAIFSSAQRHERVRVGWQFKNLRDRASREAETRSIESGECRSGNP